MPISLTSHLRDSESPIRRFMHKHFPNTAPIARDLHAKLAGVKTIRPAKKVPYTLLGTAIDYRLRYYFAVTSFSEFDAYLGAMLMQHNVTALVGWPGVSKGLMGEFFRSLERLLKRLRPVGRRLRRPQEEVLNRCCVVLALFDEAFHSSSWFIGSPIVSPKPKMTVDGLMAIAKPHWIDDLCSLSWAFYERFGDMLSYPTVPNPMFGGELYGVEARPDLIVDRCLIDIKTTIHPKLKRFWLYQLLGYVLLDYTDRYRIRSIGIDRKSTRLNSSH